MREERAQNPSIEFIALMASLMSLVSLAMDALLPALGVIEKSLSITTPSQSQMLITMTFLGLGIGQLISGPLSDSVGRKPVIYIGFFIFIVASFISTQAQSVEMMLIGRLLQGVGLSAPKTISVAMVRDSASGDHMARVMSFVTVVFILVPAIAPAYGKLLLDSSGWKSIFYSQIVIAILVSIWFAFRQRETLHDEYRIKLKAKLFVEGAKYFAQSRQAMFYTVVLGFMSGAFLVFLSTAQNILGTQFDMEDQFPMLFAIVAASIGASTLLNGMLVVRFGMRRLVMFASVSFSAIALLYVVLFSGAGNPSIYTLMIFLVVLFLNFGFIFGNLSALAMEPLGKIAGIGAAINGFLSTVIAVPVASIIGAYITDTALPLFAGFAISGTLSILLISIYRILNART